MNHCEKCHGEKRIKTMDPVLFRIEWKECHACRDESEPAPNMERIGSFWSDFEFNFDFWK